MNVKVQNAKFKKKFKQNFSFANNTFVPDEVQNDFFILFVLLNSKIKKKIWSLYNVLSMYNVHIHKLLYRKKF